MWWKEGDFEHLQLAEHSCRPVASGQCYPSSNTSIVCIRNQIIPCSLHQPPGKSAQRGSAAQFRAKPTRMRASARGNRRDAAYDLELPNETRDPPTSTFPSHSKHHHLAIFNLDHSSTSCPSLSRWCNLYHFTNGPGGEWSTPLGRQRAPYRPSSTNQTPLESLSNRRQNP
jgi:hypothetical protein